MVLLLIGFAAALASGWTPWIIAVGAGLAVVGTTGPAIDGRRRYA